MEILPLNKDQQYAADIIESTSDNVCLVGKPGVGKSVLINWLTAKGEKFYHLTAPTGLAALNINGKTLHSTFRISTTKGIIPEDYNIFTNEFKVISYIRSIKYLIIDEVSMVRGDMFDYLDRYMRFAKQNQSEPFGGAQVIIIGDFFQLPPVANKIDENELKKAGYSSTFVFSSKVFQNNFKVIALNEVMRQKGDPEFIDLLESARYGQMLPKQVRSLNEHVGHPGDLRINLASRNDDADKVNQRELSVLPGKEYVFQGNKYGDWPAYPADPLLKLKVGAQVIVKMNRADRPPSTRDIAFESKVMNGTLGVVKSIHQSQKQVEDVEDGEKIEDERVVIELQDGTEATIYRKRWEKKVKEKVPDGEGGTTWEERTVASYEQMPLALAWSISIHKSQGQSFGSVHIDASRIFMPGQLYVAISRCRTKNGLSFETPLSTKMFWANRHAVRFMEEYVGEVI